MKLSKTTWLVLAIGLFIILGASLGVAYAQQANQQSQLEQELSLAQGKMDKLSIEELSSRQEQLERRLRQAELSLRSAETRLSQSIESIEATDALFIIAERYGVEITEVGSSATTDAEVKGVTCRALPVSVLATGDMSSLINFVTEWTSQYSTGVVESVQIAVPQLTEGEEEETTANIRMRIYTYGGD